MKKKMENKEILLNLKYYKSYFDQKNSIYYGGVSFPKYVKELKIDITEDYSFDLEKEQFYNNGKYLLEITGTNRALKELGKYLINLSVYKSKDPDYHDHIDNIVDFNNIPKTNLIIRKQSKEKD